MIEAPLPRSEAERIKALLDYELLDTPPEPQFDDLTALASNICETPIALISLVDSNRQWFKSAVGLAAKETSRKIAFCSHAILQQRLFEIEDARQDERFADNPLVTGDPQIRFYAGAPLETATGHRLGTLCVIDRSPRALSSQQQEALRALARQAVALMELRRHIGQREHLLNELRTAYERLKILDGLLSVCAGCKNIRDAQGDWKQMEEYLIIHSEAQLTHKFCPSCVKKLYPKTYEKLAKQSPDEFRLPKDLSSPGNAD